MSAISKLNTPIQSSAVFVLDIKSKCERMLELSHDQPYGPCQQDPSEDRWAKTIKKNTNSTQNKSQTHRAKQYEVTSFLSTDCELSTETCSKNVYSLGP